MQDKHKKLDEHNQKIADQCIKEINNEIQRVMK